jgi:hypothetical protein
VIIAQPNVLPVHHVKLWLRSTRNTLKGIAMIFDGKTLFKMKSEKGFPLDFALDRIINQEKKSVDWVSFIETARDNEWWDFQTYEVICHAMEDAGISAALQEGIRQRFKLYVLANPHPKMNRIPHIGDTPAILA